jgi:hypothetical protein
LYAALGDYAVRLGSVALYAAYGSNMDPAQMLERCPHSPQRGTGWLEGWRLTFGGEDIGWDGALTTVVEDAAQRVFVVLYDVPEIDEKELDTWDGVTLGFYRKLKVRVQTLDGDLLAWLYVLDAYEGGLPSARHLSILVDAAIKAGAPIDYVEWLRARPSNPPTLADGQLPGLGEYRGEQRERGDDDGGGRGPAPGAHRRAGGPVRRAGARASGERAQRGHHALGIRGGGRLTAGGGRYRRAEQPAAPRPLPRAALRAQLGGGLPAAGRLHCPRVDNPRRRAAFARAAERPLAPYAEQIGPVDPGHGRPADPVVAQRVPDRHPVVVGDDARPLRRYVHQTGHQQQDEHGHDREMIAALHGQVDQVADRERRPQPPDRHRERGSERLPGARVAAGHLPARGGLVMAGCHRSPFVVNAPSPL